MDYIGIRIDSDIKARLDKQKEEHGIPISYYVSTAIKEKLDRDAKEPTHDPSK